MIPGSGIHTGDGSVTTLDDLFRRAGVQRPGGPALIDPPNRDCFAGGPPLTLNFSEADRVITALAARLRALGLTTDTQVAIQLPNTVESVIAFMAVLRAGMIAVPLPLLWRKQEIVAALSHINVKAIITCARAGAVAQAEIAVQSAAELFPVRFVCGFGAGLPDGTVLLDDIFAPARLDFTPALRRNGNPADHVAAVTFDMTGNGLAPVMHSHRALIEAGHLPFREAGLAADGHILSTIPIGSFAGLALTVLPWIIGGTTLSLHHGFDPDVFASQMRRQNAVVLPGAMVAPLTATGRLAADKTILALWRAPDRLAAAEPWHGTATLADVSAFSETTLRAARRRPDGLPAPVPPGRSRAPAGGITVVGGYRFLQAEVDGMIANADAAATIVALPDALLGQRFAGTVNNAEAMQSQLQAIGANPLIAGAFQPRSPTQSG